MRDDLLRGGTLAAFVLWTNMLFRLDNGSPLWWILTVIAGLILSGYHLSCFWRTQ